MISAGCGVPAAGRESSLSSPLSSSSSSARRTLLRTDPRLPAESLPGVCFGPPHLWPLLRRKTRLARNSEEGLFSVELAGCPWHH